MKVSDEWCASRLFPPQHQLSPCLFEAVVGAKRGVLDGDGDGDGGDDDDQMVMVW
jgi:hypothetical protein